MLRKNTVLEELEAQVEEHKSRFADLQSEANRLVRLIANGYLRLGDLANENPDMHLDAIPFYQEGLKHLTLIPVPEKGRDDKDIELIHKLQLGVHSATERALVINLKKKKSNNTKNSSGEAAMSAPSSAPPTPYHLFRPFAATETYTGTLLTTRRRSL